MKEAGSTMGSTVGQIEKKTQRRVVRLFREQLGYEDLGDWTEREGNRNIGSDYFDELLERIRDIGSSEKHFCQKIRDIYKLAVDYDPKAEDQVRLRRQVFIRDQTKKPDPFLQFDYA